jgi:hypothetical protein
MPISATDEFYYDPWHVTRDVELHGKTVPQGSAILTLIGAANRDQRRFGEAPSCSTSPVHRAST